MVLPVKTPSGSRPPSPLAAIVVTVGMKTAIGAKAPNNMSAECTLLAVRGLVDPKVRSEKRKGIREVNSGAVSSTIYESSQASNGGCARQKKSRGLGSMHVLTCLFPAQVVGDASPAHPARHVHRGQPDQVRRSEPAADQR